MEKKTIGGFIAALRKANGMTQKDLAERLPGLNRGLYEQVKAVLDENKAERHIRGGIATRMKYKGEATEPSRTARME